MTRTRPILAALVALLLSGIAWAAPASDFSLRDMDGNTFQLGEHKGKVIVLSFWATWCKPCIEELPRLTQWRDELQARVPYELVFLSADAEVPEVETFAKAHPEVAGTLQLQDAEGLVPWTQGLGLPGTPMLPVHLFVDERDRVRCIRTAGIGEDDRAAIEQLMVSM